MPSLLCCALETGRLLSLFFVVIGWPLSGMPPVEFEDDVGAGRVYQVYVKILRVSLLKRTL